MGTFAQTERQLALFDRSTVREAWLVGDLAVIYACFAAGRAMNYPVVAEELARDGDSIVCYVESTSGLTGLWQVSGRNDLDYRCRVRLDCWYVKNWSLWCDLVILIKTPRAVLRGSGAY